MAMGAGAIAPGVSGGALAVIFGLYDKITYFIAHFDRNFKQNLLFFIPVGIGGGAGVLLFSQIIELLFQNYEKGVRFAFAGLMLGTFPAVVNEANKKGYRNKYLAPFIISLTFTLIITYLENNAVNIIKDVETSPVHVVIYGIIIGFGTIIPGISASIILMYMGAYETVIGAISDLNIAFIFFLGIGFVLSVLLFAKIISLLFEHAYGMTYYTILGLVLGSIIAILPQTESPELFLSGFIVLVVCGTLSYMLSCYAAKK